ncbi:MAG: type II/IV secretion system ATPase subunit [Candidatus Thermoplasmatota archaeon]|nr:type II/IV secretion system ATPase subunit [Candidatus Thermoplasmatota archaeon]
MTGSKKKDIFQGRDQPGGSSTVKQNRIEGISPPTAPRVHVLPERTGPSTGPGPDAAADGSKPSVLSAPPARAGDDGDVDVNEEKKGDPVSFRKITDSFKGLFKKQQKEIHIYKVPRTKESKDSVILEGLEKIDTRDLGSKYVYVEIYLDKETNEFIYHPVEPQLAPKQKEVYDFIIETFNKSLKYDRKAMETNEEKEKFIESEVMTILKDYSMFLTSVNEDFLDPIMYYIKREYIGYGRIQSIMMDVGVEDVSCDGTNIPIFIYHRDFGSIQTTIKFETDEELEGFVVSLSQKAGKSISVADPILDATLPEGHRLNATYGREVTTRGSSFTIRKFKEDPLTITDLVKFGTISPEMAAHIWMAVQYGDSMIFAGGTASGKTATMNAVSIFIPPSAKIISIEDTREVNLPHENWIAGLTRGSADSGKDTDIDMYQLLRAALRQRPEYVLVGEVRGKETMTMFQAMATGHITYSTMHADSVKSIVYRLENPPISIPRVLIQALNLVAIHNQLRVKGMRVRRVTELVEIVGIEPTSLEIITNRVYKWEPAGDTFVFGGHSNLYEKIMDMDDMTRDEVVTELNRRAEVIEWMVRNEVRMFKDVSSIVAEYYENPEKVIEIMRENYKVDISEGMHIFDKIHKEKVSPTHKDTVAPAILPGLPTQTDREQIKHSHGGA